ncbi:Acetyltransferase (GNAT) domain-containing protein [Paenibacillus sp. UNC496MF]|uniref:GNAT family N-acetyltransferase n=1 Tax=Paenibacillus sp. UNC496MF TaxID=1502753 RepID=UPI0008E09F6E|nr:GNAT family protein [Paenibacillus sp. UNC496MF]SFJ41543.1 Acetyltransferase (GNAT) domain-containing protein [Paenibacillus sp. UNC496MF]
MNIREGEKVRLQAIVPEDRAAFHANDQDTEGARLSDAVGGCLNSHGCDPRNGTFQYGIAIFRPQWRKGCAHEAARLLLRYYFRELRYEKAAAHVHAFNESSAKLQEKLGFRREGPLRSALFTNCHRHDEHLYGLLKDEFVF